MKMYIDESIHANHDFMIIAYVLCEIDPQSELEAILSDYDINEFHARTQMVGNIKMQKVRNEFLNFINTRTMWGIIILPNNRNYIINDTIFMIESIINIYNISIEVFIDEGMLRYNEIELISNVDGVISISSCVSHEINGIQLADLVASLNGIRLREEISGEPKILIYGEKYGFDPPIEATLGFELWTKLRYSMMKDKMPYGDDMPEMATFSTHGHGLFISSKCSPQLTEIAKKLFGHIYLGCIH